MAGVLCPVLLQTCRRTAVQSLSQTILALALLKGEGTLLSGTYSMYALLVYQVLLL